MPGWSEGTVGYHVDDGKIYHAKDPDKGKQVEGNIDFHEISYRAFFRLKELFKAAGYFF